MTTSAQAAVLVSLAADALSLGAHWFYDMAEIDRRFRTGNYPNDDGMTLEERRLHAQLELMRRGAVVPGSRKPISPSRLRSA